jgi:predicted Zn-dependent peptidase
MAQDLPKLNVQRLKLKNGLTVLALEDHTVPSIAFYTLYKVGSRNERPGITGLSHLFEHMMFNGSARFKPKMFDRLVEAGGGYSNAFTNSDTTEYFEEVSSATLDTVLQLESDRMRSLKIDSQNLEQERGIVKEERRVNTDNTIPGSMYEVLWNHAFVAHPYRWDTIGFMKDLNAIQVADARSYFKTYYAPNNAVVVVVGDFQTKTLFEGMHRYFEDIPAQIPPAKVINAEPPQQGEKRIQYHRTADLPAIFFGYKIGTNRDADDPALDLLSTILSNGDSSRLYKSLIYDQQIANEVSASNESRIDPGLFTFYAQASPGQTAEACETAILKIIEEVKANGVTERELRKAKNARLNAVISRFATNLGRAGLLAGFEAHWGNWNQIYQSTPKYEKVTLADIQRVAKKYFQERTRTVVVLRPEKPEGAGN